VGVVWRVGHLIVGVLFVGFSVKGDIKDDRVGGGELIGVFDRVGDFDVRVRVDKLGDAGTECQLL